MSNPQMAEPVSMDIVEKCWNDVRSQMPHNLDYASFREMPPISRTLLRAVITRYYTLCVEPALAQAQDTKTGFDDLARICQDYQRMLDQAISALKASDQAQKHVIQLTPSEVQSGFDRVRWAAGLIRQLLEINPNHEGAKSWLLNYGSKPVSGHASDCAVHNAPALPPGACDCGKHGV